MKNGNWKKKESGYLSGLIIPAPGYEYPGGRDEFLFLSLHSQPSYGLPKILLFCCHTLMFPDFLHHLGYRIDDDLRFV
jgi:hypothetical protein